MKKYIIALMAFFAMTGNVYAQDKLYVDNVQIPQGGQAELTINLLSEENENAYLAFQFDLQLPAGISIADPENDYAQADRLTEATKNWSIAPKLIDAQNNIYNFIVYNMPNATIGGTDGPVLYVTLTADASLAIGAELADGIIKNAIISTKEQKHYSAEGTFKIEIIENIVTLDENSTIAPNAAENVNVHVKRSIKPDVWNTICLPFDMTAAQLKESLGDYQLANFTGYDASFDTDGKSIASIKVNFETVEAIEANHPYIIKVAEAVSYDTGFTVDEVTIAPTETPVVNCDVTTTVTIPGMGEFTQTTTKQFIGTYVANTIIPADRLYISNNMFYYSKGSSSLKAFRGYFNFSQVLTDKTVSGGAKLSFSVDGEATTIDGIGQQRIVEGIYDLSGRKIKLEDGDLTKLQKGVYIIDGKKVTIK